MLSPGLVNRCGRSHMYGMRRKTRTHRDLSLGMNAVVFVVVLTLVVIARSITTFSLASPYECNDVLTLQHGETSYQAGMIDTLWLAVCAAGALVITLTALSLLRRSYSWSDVALGTVNFAMVILLSLYCLISWAFVEPGGPGAHHINRLAVVVTDWRPLALQERQSRQLAEEPGWEILSETKRQNVSIGIIESYETVRRCFSRGLVEANDQSRFNYFSGNATGHGERKDWVYYTLDGKFITTSSSNWRPEWREKRRQAEKDPDVMSLEDFQEAIAPRHPRDLQPVGWAMPSGPEPLTYDEILARIEAAWDEEERTKD